MKKSLFLLVAFAFIISNVNAQTTIIYPGAGWYNDIFDLTTSDLTIQYTLDMSGYIPPAMWNTAWISVGIYGGASGWMSSGAPAAHFDNEKDYDYSVPKDGIKDPALDMDDKHNLGAPPTRWDESSYDATDPNTVVPPFGTGDNYGIWFDRDGVDPWQPSMWGMVDGGNYNTGGIYNIFISYHAINSTLGTMFASVNGIQPGFNIAGWHSGQPDIWPAGKSISGDLTQLKIFADGLPPEVIISDITVQGYLIPEPGTILLLGSGFLGLGLIGWYRRRKA